jgi:hypothetical protein
MYKLSFRRLLVSFGSLLFCSFSGVALAQGLGWVKTTGGYGASCAGMSIVQDEAGNSYLVSLFKGTIDADPGNGVTSVTAIGATDMLIQKFSGTGSLLWAKQVGGPGTNHFLPKIGIDSTGHVVIADIFNGTSDFDPGPDTFNLASSGLSDVAVVRLTAAGNFDWAVNITGPSTESLAGMHVDHSGNVYLIGSFSVSMDFEPGSGVNNLTCNGSSDIYLVKLDRHGNVVLLRQLGGSTGDFGYCVTVDNLNNIIVSGTFNGAVDFDPGPATFNISPIGFQDMFIEKLDAGGNFIWAKQIGGDSAYLTEGVGIATDASGNIYNMGRFEGEEADFDPGPAVSNISFIPGIDLFLQKLDKDGNFIWAENPNTADFASALAIDEWNDIYLAGNMQGTVDFDPLSTNYELTSYGATDFYLQKLNPSGGMTWALCFGGIQHDAGTSLSVSDGAHVLLAGVFSDTMDFDPGPSVVNKIPKGLSDNFILELNIPTGINDPYLYTTVAIAPNPTSGLLHIEGILPGTKLEIVDLAGRILMTENLSPDGNLSVSALASGAYFLRTMYGTAKLIKN